MANLFDSAKNIQEKRAILKELSKPLQELTKTGKIESVNAGLKSIYQSDGHRELKSFYEWKKEGKKIKKGEHALCLWGKPKQKIEEQEQEEQNRTNDGLEFFPICYVFSNLQVQ